MTIEPGALNCPFCDFSMGYRGMDRCPKCDGTGSVFFVDGRYFPNTKEGFEKAMKQIEQGNTK